MKLFTDYIINEHFVNCKNEDEMRKYGNIVWDILQKAYEYCGGIKNVNSVDDLIEGDSRYTQKKNRAKSKQLSEDEQNLLVKYRELSAKEKNAVIGLCDLLINH
jgi:hypothetical protein